jgi:hypothetical protein
MIYYLKRIIINMSQKILIPMTRWNVFVLCLMLWKVGVSTSPILSALYDRGAFTIIILKRIHLSLENHIETQLWLTFIMKQTPCHVTLFPLNSTQLFLLCEIKYHGKELFFMRTKFQFLWQVLKEPMHNQHI